MEKKTRQIVLAALFLALGLIVPYIFHTTGIPGQIFLPMHIPVLLCGCILGKRNGFIVGFITPLLNSLLTGLPPFYPTGLAMALELAAYGFVSGYMYKDRKANILLSLVIAMFAGRMVLGMANYILFFFMGNKYLFSIFIASSFTKPFLGIVIQLVLIPIIIKLIKIDVIEF